MNKIVKFSLLFVLTILLSCCGTSQQKATENKTDSTEKKVESSPKEEKSENSNASDKDDALSRSLVGDWVRAEGGDMDINYGNISFKEDAKSFSGSGGEFMVEGTYSVKNGELIILGKTVEIQAGSEYNHTFTSIEIADKTPIRLTLKSAKGETVIFEKFPPVQN